MRDRIHSHELVQAILTYWRNGATYQETAKKFNQTTTGIGSIIRRYMTDDDKLMVAEKRAAVDRTIENIMGMWRSGLTYEQMAEKSGETKGFVTGVINRNKKKGETSFRKNSFGFTSLHRKVAPSELGLMTLSSESSKSKMFEGTIPRAFYLVRFKKCQWIAGDPSGDDKIKCNKPTGKTRVYCPAHEVKSVRVFMNKTEQEKAIL